MGRFGMGQAIRRVEDLRFLTGSGTFTDDVVVPGAARLFFLRSPYAHGDITALDTDAARAAAGVLAVLTIGDLDDAGVSDLSCMGVPEDVNGDTKEPLRQPVLARSRVRYVGEPVAAIVAETLDQAVAAAALVGLEVDERDAVVSPADAVVAGAPQLWPAAPGNVLATCPRGDASATDAAFASAAEIVSISVVNNRLAPTPMEPRGCLARYDAEADGYVVHQGCQGVHALRRHLAAALGIDEAKLRVVSPDVGGGFGLRLFCQSEPVVAAVAARATGRPVKWIAERTEGFLSDLHGRDQITHAELALDEDGRFTALRIATLANLGAYTSEAGCFIPWFGTSMATGCYDIPAAYAEVQLVVTNTVPVDAYRGAGRPEAIYLIERLADEAARVTGIPPEEIRRRNFIRPDAFPYASAFGQSYDTGDYERLMRECMKRAQWTTFDERRSQAAGRGRLRGIGMSYYVEICAGFGDETPHVTLERDGGVSVLVGTQSTGQGHETSLAQIVADRLGIDIEGVHVRQGDTALIPTGTGTAGSRTLAIAGSALRRTVDTVIEAGRTVAGAMLEASVADIVFDAGTFRIAGTDRSATLAEVVAATWDEAKRPPGIEPGLHAAETFAPEGGTFPNGCHICEVEVDPDTGVVDIVRYWIEDDVGTVVNPLLLEGQIVGGAAQGIGQALFEEAVYERESGQLQAASFLDYTMPRADTIPAIEFDYDSVPTPRNPLGVKGAGEAGTIGAPPAVVNAVLNALSPVGVTHLDMPLTPLKVWSAIRAARG